MHRRGVLLTTACVSPPVKTGGSENFIPYYHTSLSWTILLVGTHVKLNSISQNGCTVLAVAPPGAKIFNRGIISGSVMTNRVSITTGTDATELKSAYIVSKIKQLQGEIGVQHLLVNT